MILYDTKYFKVFHIVIYVLKNYCNALITAFWYWIKVVHFRKHKTHKMPSSETNYHWFIHLGVGEFTPP